MLQDLDRTASDTLRSFSEALQQAQLSLQREEERLVKATQLLQEIVAQNDQLKSTRVHNSQQRQRLEALQREKIKLKLYLQQQRDDVEREQERVRLLRIPRGQIQEAAAQCRKDTLSYCIQYIVRTAQVHGLLTQCFHPHRQLPHLRRLALQRRDERDTAAAQVTALQLHREVQIGKLANFLNAFEEDGRLNDDHAEGGSSGACHAHVPMIVDAQYDKSPAVSHLYPSLSLPQAQQQLEMLQMEQDQCRLTHRVARDNLLAQRHQLKEEVKNLCGLVEEADTRQQTAQVQMDMVLNEVTGSCGSGGMLCSVCRCDILAAFL